MPFNSLGKRLGFFVITPATIFMILYFQRLGLIHEISFRRYLNRYYKNMITNKEGGKRDEISRPEKIILVWTKVFGGTDLYFGFGHEPFLKSGCPVHQCRTTNQRQLLNQSDAVLFHIGDMSRYDIPRHRKSHQRWIFFMWESPMNTPNILRAYPDFFNWTMTYRMDSDVYNPYDSWSPDLVGGLHSRSQLRKELQTKKKLVAWFVSHCPTVNRREKYAEELQKYIDVDIYGKCGPLKCDSHNRTRCYQMLATDYKFYLAFENSVCRDYVTEKFFSSLSSFVVPIVYGGADYSIIAPSHSYINVRDFSSPRELAKYLIFLDHNMTAYEEYFYWKIGYQSKNYNGWCRLCEMLHDDSLPNRSHKDIHHWWFNESHCGQGNII